MQRPDPELERKLANVRLVLMDIDGTLVSANKPDFEAVIQQLRRLRGLNIKFSLATGRTIAGSYAVLNRLKTVNSRLPAMINYNGAVLALNQSGIEISRLLQIERQIFSKLVHYLRARSLKPVVYTCIQILPAPPKEEVFAERASSTSTEFNGMHVQLVDDLNVIEAPVVAVLLEQDTPSIAAALAANMALDFPELRVTTSGGKYVEICNIAGSKLNAMTRLAAAEHISNDNVFAVGDNLNDIEMIEAAGVGVCVGDAHPVVKNAADIVCTMPGAEGVVEALRMLIRAHRNAKAHTSGSVA